MRIYVEANTFRAKHDRHLLIMKDRTNLDNKMLIKHYECYSYAADNRVIAAAKRSRQRSTF